MNRKHRASLASWLLLAAIVILTGKCALAQATDPELGRMLERALADAENFRKQMQTAQYESTIRVQEWNGRGQLRGTARAKMIVKPGDPHPITYVSREVHGKVKLPDSEERSKEEEKDKTTLQEFSRSHNISERFTFVNAGSEEVAGERAARIQFTPNHTQPEKNTGDKFLDSITGAVWITEEKNRLVKFELRLMHPFQLFWIFAVLKELSIEYELITPGDILGHAKLKVVYALRTPIYSLKQQHDVEMDHFQRRDLAAAIADSR